MTRTAAWKEHERRTARRLSGQRSPNTGKQTADVTAGVWSIECKSRKDLPAWLLDAMTQARRNAGDGQTGIVVLHQVGQRSDKDIVCLTLADFTAWAGGINAETTGD